MAVESKGIKLIVIAITVLLVFCVLLKIVDFLLILRRENSKGYYRLFVCLSTAFLFLMAYLVADFVGPQISEETRNTTRTVTLIFVCTFLLIYKTCACLDNHGVVVCGMTGEDPQDTLPKAPPKSATVQPIEVDLDPPKYEDLFPPPYSPALRGDFNQV